MLIDASLDDTWQVLGELTLSSEPDHRDLSADPIMEVIRELNLPIPCLERLQQSVAETFRNAMQHRDGSGPEEKILVRVLVSRQVQPIKRQSPGGWGCFLIEGAAHAPSGSGGRVIELCVYREGGKDG
jgi:anti-sigma regulatory factor (Ser/Thr protein kinase)